MTQPEQPDQPSQTQQAPAGAYAPPRQSIPGIRPPGLDPSVMGVRGRAFGREIEEAAQRVARDPTVSGFADVAARTWGFILLAFGVWFLADVTLGFSLPGVPWEDLWPAALILVGILVVVRGMSRRGA